MIDFCWQIYVYLYLRYIVNIYSFVLYFLYNVCLNECFNVVIIMNTVYRWDYGILHKDWWFLGYTLPESHFSFDPKLSTYLSVVRGNNRPSLASMCLFCFNLFSWQFVFAEYGSRETEKNIIDNDLCTITILSFFFLLHSNILKNYIYER